MKEYIPARLVTVAGHLSTVTTRADEAAEEGTGLAVAVGDDGAILAVDDAIDGVTTVPV